MSIRIEGSRQDLVCVRDSSSRLFSTESPESERAVNDLGGSPAESKALQARLLSGSFVLLAGTGSVTVMNLIYNVVVARFLGPTGFGHVAAVCTLLILISAVMLSFQIVSTKIVAQQKSLEEKIRAYRRLHVHAWVCGILAGLFLFLFQSPISRYLNLPAPVLVVLLGIGAILYVPLGTCRGYLQGSCHFGRLSFNLALEGAVKLVASLVLIKLGYGAAGVIAANVASVALAYTFAVPATRAGGTPAPPITVAFREGLQAFVFFAGAVIINNADILLVKHFFAGPPAGLYAAIALVGRVVYVLAFSVASSMFPIAAEARAPSRRTPGVLSTSLILVLAIGVVLTAGLRLAPSGVWSALFGARFGVSSTGDFSYLLPLYAATTSVYALSVVIILYEMSHKIAGAGWLQLAFSGALVAAIYKFHSSLAQVIWVQMAVVAFLLVVVAVPILVRSLFGTEDIRATPANDDIRILRRASEDEVIAEFLKTDFCTPDFKDYQALYPLVTKPDLESPCQNQLRRALFSIRHGALWRELPEDTQWFEVEVRTKDLSRIYVFPRAHWRRLARDSFSLPAVVPQISTQPSANGAEETFRSKIRNLGDLIAQNAELGAILLIGRSQRGPFTILDGNHRLAAAMLVSSVAAPRFRFFCGISANMTSCCWYETNFATLCRYAANLMKYLADDPQAKVARLLQKPEFLTVEIK